MRDDNEPRRKSEVIRIFLTSRPFHRGRLKYGEEFTARSAKKEAIAMKNDDPLNLFAWVGGRGLIAV